MVKDYKEKKEELQKKYNFPDTRFSPHLFTQLFEEIEKMSNKISEIELRLDVLEKKVK